MSYSTSTGGGVNGNTSARSGRTGDAWEFAARAGYAVSGLLHIVVGILIFRMATGGSGEDADQTAALSSIGESTFGGIILWSAVVAFVALGAWQAADAVRGSDTKDRAKAAGKVGVYFALAVTSWSVATGSDGEDGDSRAQSFATTLMEAPAGRVLVGAVGLGILVAGGFHVWSGWTQKFRENLRTPSGQKVSRAVTITGTVGYIAKGVALGVVGVLFTYAAISADPDQAQGIDGAVESLLEAPAGPLLVILVGVGFAAYGVYSFARARYARM